PRSTLFPYTTLFRSHRGHLSLRLGSHGFVEDPARVGMFLKVSPEPLGERFLGSRMARPDAVLEFAVRVPVHAQSEHPGQRAHRVRVVRAEQPRSLRMAHLLAVELEH